ncbi:MAG: hypothetical protein M3R38_10635 [Actinomycetota bacterium]|nr:hypothetical protein [Actinomycetota bacterium]
MEPDRKRKVGELYDRIDLLDRRLAKAARRGERAPQIARELVVLREEARRALEPETKEVRPGVSRRAIRPVQNARSAPKSPSPTSAAGPSDDKPQRNLNLREGIVLPGSPQTTSIDLGSDGEPTTRPPRAQKSKSIAGHDVRALARDYIHKRLDELKHVILNGRGSEREEARRERAFLEEQLRIAYGKGPRKWDFDPALMRAVRESILKTPCPRAEEAPNDLPQASPDPPAERPPYWQECEGMDFRRLLQFMRDSLREPSALGADGRPRSKQELLALWEMLCAKVEVPDAPATVPKSAEAPELPRFVPSRQLKTLQTLLDRLEQLKGASTAAPVGPNAGESSRQTLKRKLKKAKDAYERRLWEEKGAHKRKLKEAKDAAVHKLRQQRDTRLRIIKSIRRDIETTFELGTVPPTGRLSWRILPPGELSVHNVLRHYDVLQQHNPHISYERERINKAFSLRPDRCYVGSDEFEGYIVLTFAHTPRVLLECPVFGNAIYVVDFDWRRLSRMTKQDLLSRDSLGVTRIVHKGDWFSRVKRALGIR